MRTKSGSCVKVSFSILNRFPLLTLSFNSLSLSGDDPLMSLTTTLPRLSLAPILNNLVKFKAMPRPSTLPIIPSKLASNALFKSKVSILRIGLGIGVIRRRLPSTIRRSLCMHVKFKRA